MKAKQILKIAVDAAMTIALLLLMAYELIGQAAHEWLGIGVFTLFVLHHILNRHWHRGLFKGRYTALRWIQTALVILILLAMCGSMVSGILLSRHALSFLPVSGWAFARNLHMLSAYWGFVLMSLHLGFHWSMVVGLAKKLTARPSKLRKYILRSITLLIAGYGVYAFFKRNIGSYMILANQFAFFDFEEPFLWFLLDYMACMGTFVSIGHYGSALFRNANVKKVKRRQTGPTETTSRHQHETVMWQIEIAGYGAFTANKNMGT